jgi:uncharacterized protein (DUF427 family)
MHTTPLSIEITDRLQREAERWRSGNRRPHNIVQPKAGETSVWDFPRPPSVERVHERVTIDWAGQTIVDTSSALRVCETAAPPTYYIHRRDFPEGSLIETGGRSECEWKGPASYYSILIEGETAEAAAWIYPSLHPEYSVLRDFFGVYASRVDRCTVAGLEVRPQPGSFYAGWITPDLVGPFKGSAGSEGW